MLQIAERWFQTRTAAADTTLVWEPHVHPFLRCNIWHVRGRDRDMLVDTGLGVTSVREAISDLIDKPVVAIATHIHYDHVGGLHEFETRVMHRIEAPRMRDYREPAPLHLSAFAEFGDAMRHPDFGELLLNARPPGFDIDAYRVQSVAPTREVDDGDVVDLGNRHFEVMHLPGHSPGSLGLWEAASGTLFSGDAIYDGLLLDELPDSDIGDYCNTMRRLRALPVSVVHGGHEPSFGRERLVAIADDYLARRGGTVGLSANMVRDA